LYLFGVRQAREGHASLTFFESMPCHYGKCIDTYSQETKTSLDLLDSNTTHSNAQGHLKTQVRGARRWLSNDHGAHLPISSSPGTSALITRAMPSRDPASVDFWIS
jgi:hypothetical protein